MPIAKLRISAPRDLYAKKVAAYLSHPVKVPEVHNRARFYVELERGRVLFANYAKARAVCDLSKRKGMPSGG